MDHMDANGSIAGVFLLLVVVAIYLLPAIVASRRGHHNAAAITVLNIFLGWTFLGWVLALVWACTETHRTASAQEADRDAGEGVVLVGKPVSQEQWSPIALAVLAVLLLFLGIAFAQYVGWLPPSP